AMNSLLVNTPDILLNKTKLEISIFPNPARENIKIYTHNDYFIRRGLLRMFNAFGNEVLVLENIQSDNFDLKIDGLPEGLYIIKVDDLETNLSTTGKIVVQRR
ncbi:MAG: T9SS type A sorting domain-containing protein, partial [Candidatus Moranbacteria bacterium]|nr:T9SS type A sorting domain-containing protein [Candidatus Moranbacteria bacterium]